MTLLRQTTFPPEYFSSFGKQRIAGEGNRLDVQFTYGLGTEFMDQVTSGGATITHDSAKRHADLKIVNATNGTSAKLSSYPVPYTPGNGQEIEITGVLDHANLDTGTAEVFLRSKVSGVVSEQVVTQASWMNLTSGRDWDKSFILQVDFQSLTVGTVRYWIVTDGAPVQIAQINNDNVRNTGYWQTPSLPQYWRIYNDTGETLIEFGYGNEDNGLGIRYRMPANASATMTAVCSTVKSEGGVRLVDLPGLRTSFTRGITAGTVPSIATGSFQHVFSLKPAATFNSIDNLILSIPEEFIIAPDQTIDYRILHDTSLSGASWTPVNASRTPMEYDTAGTVSGGYEVASGRIFADTSGGNAYGATSQGGILGKTLMWNRLGSVPTGILTIVAQAVSSAANTVAGITWKDIR